MADRVALITGGAKGIGRGIALDLAAQQWSVAICFRTSEAEATATANAITSRGGRALSIRCDVSDPRAAKGLVAQVEQQWGRIDALINGAGPYHRVNLFEETTEGWNEMFDGNLHPIFYLAQAVAPGMKARKSGHIINFSMANADQMISQPDVTAHYIAKAGVLILTRTLAKLLAGLPGDRDVDPEALFDKLASEFPVTRGAIESEFREVFRGIPMDAESGRAAREAFLTDAWNLALAERVHADPGIAATFVYLPGLDILRHRLAQADDTSGEFAATLRAYVAWLSRRTEAMWAREPGAMGVLVADPGRLTGPDSEGFLAMFGPGVRPGCVSEAHSITAVTPALLAIAGFPASDELEPLPAAVCLRAAASRPARVATYGRREPDVGPSDPEADREVLERLRSLGYVE